METEGKDELLKELVGFLAPSCRVDVRIEAAKSILVVSSQEDLKVEHEKVKQAWTLFVVPELVRWIGDQPKISQPCIQALTNLSAIGLFSPNSACVSNKASFWRWLFEEIGASHPLLVNLTAHPQGPGKVNEMVIGGAGRACAELLGLASRKTTPTVVSEACVSTTRNLTVNESSRNTFTPQSFLLLSQTVYSGESIVLRRDSAGALRNLLLDKNDRLVGYFLDCQGPALLAATLLLHVEREDLVLHEDRNERVGMPPVLLDIFTKRVSTNTLERSEEVDSLVVDVLLLCAASSKRARENMRKLKIYPCLRCFHPLVMEDGAFENEDLSNRVYELVELLISDEEEEGGGGGDEKDCTLEAD